MDLALLVLRLAAGLTVAAHGAQKLFGWFDGPGRKRFAGYLDSLSLRRPSAWVWVAGLAELAGGLLLALGLLTPLAVAAVVGQMLAATLVVHLSNGFFNTEGGFEFPLLIALVAASIGIAGPGAYALDSAFGLPAIEPALLTAGIIVGIVAALAVAAARRAWAHSGGAEQAGTA